MQENCEDLPQSSSFIEVIRENIRHDVSKHREALKSKAVDALRLGLGEIHGKISDVDNITVKDVKGVAMRIKRKKHATEEDMCRLSCAFLQDLQNIRTFADIPGALQVIVKELTGRDSERSVAALECLCNLSLGDGPVCEKIINKAGSYLVTFLHNDDECLKQTCLQTLANLLHSSQKAGTMLMQMQLLPLLWRIYIESNSNCCKDAGICLQLLVTRHPLLLQEEHRIYIRDNMHLKPPQALASEFHLQIIFHSNILEITKQDSQIKYLINFIKYIILNIENFKTAEERLRVIYAYRIFSNLMCLVKDNFDLETLLRSEREICENFLIKLYGFGEKCLQDERFWFLANYVNFYGLENGHVQDLLLKLNIMHENQSNDDCSMVTE